MWKKYRYRVIAILFFMIIFYGFIAVSSNLSDIVKNNSKIKVTVKKEPFSLEVDIGDYILYVNDKPLESIRQKTQALFKR